VQEHKNSYTDLETAIGKLRMLSGESQAAITSIICRLAETEGVSISIDHKLPAGNLESWVTKLRRLYLFKIVPLLNIPSNCSTFLRN